MESKIGSKTSKLFGYSKSDWAGSWDVTKSISWYFVSTQVQVLSLGLQRSKKLQLNQQKSTTTVKQVIWLRNILADLGQKQEQSTQIFVDNEATISISLNPVFHGKTKHFNVKLFYLREVQENDDVSLVYCKTEDQAAHMFTKSLPLSRFKFLRKKLGICNLQGKGEC